MKDNLTLERVSELFEYSYSSGNLIRKKSTSANARKGNIAGYFNLAGYRKTSIDGFQYYNHRLVWLLVNGRWPTKQIDHINGNKGDNRIENLREASLSENSQNRSKQSNCSSGEKCIWWKLDRQRYRVRVGVSGKYHHIGYFKNIQDAVTARDKAIKKLHGKFAKYN